MESLSAVTRLPHTLVRMNMGKIHAAMSRVRTVIAGLTRGMPLELFDRGVATHRVGRALKAVLLPAQSADGSFEPIDVYAGYAGDNARDRSYTTAMCVLSLEVYYRYFTPLLRGQ